jgi:hypothetical protein
MLRQPRERLSDRYHTVPRPDNLVRVGMVHIEAMSTSENAGISLINQF